MASASGPTMVPQVLLDAARGVEAGAVAAVTGGAGLRDAEFMFTGTGTSEGVPRGSCLLRERDCAVCKSAGRGKESKDRRLNTGGLVRWRKTPAEAALSAAETKDGEPVSEYTTVVIDCGKFWWTSVLDYFVEAGIHTIDALILTHEHFDAIGGLDNLRDFTRLMTRPLRIHCSAATYASVDSMFPYLTRPSMATGSGEIPALEFEVFEVGVPFSAAGLDVVAFPVEHGKGYYCNAFRFGEVAYVSDTHFIPDQVRPYIAGARTVVLDALWPQPQCHSSHFGIEQAVAEVETGFGVDTHPEQVWLVGMNHEMGHEVENEKLVKRGRTDMALAHDGLTFTTRVSTNVVPAGDIVAPAAPDAATTASTGTNTAATATASAATSTAVPTAEATTATDSTATASVGTGTPGAAVAAVTDASTVTEAATGADAATATE